MEISLESGLRWKKALLITVIILLALAVSGWLYFKYNQISKPALTDEEIIIKGQLESLESLRREFNLQPPTQEETQLQLENLENSRPKSKSGIAPVKLTEEQIQNQLEALQKLKNQ